MRVCPKCQQVEVLELVAEAGGVEFRRCGACQGMSMLRTQSARGQVVIAGVAILVVEAHGELEARPEQLAPKGWAEHFAKDVA